jgi:hypothetical protein
MKRFIRLLGGSGLLAAAVALGCHQAPAGISDQNERTPRAAPAASSSRRKVAEVTPEIAAKAEEILHANPNAEYDTEFPFTLGERKYVARIEVHDNPNGDPQRPQGKHKGVTVYSED